MRITGDTITKIYVSMVRIGSMTDGRVKYNTIELAEELGEALENIKAALSFFLKCGLARIGSDGIWMPQAERITVKRFDIKGV